MRLGIELLGMGVKVLGSGFGVRARTFRVIRSHTGHHIGVNRGELFRDFVGMCFRSTSIFYEKMLFREFVNVFFEFPRK